MGQKWETHKILAWLRGAYPKGSFRSRNVIEKYGMSRQTAARILSQLVLEGKIQKVGSTKSAEYSLSKQKTREVRLGKIVLLRGLKEDRVLDEILLRWAGPRLSENTSRIFAYAFTEMLNNAIDHSQSTKAEINVEVTNGRLIFSIRDSGIGIFQNIKKIFRLKREEDAVEHLLKGKQTTAPEAHSGQGIFFTSKIADQFSLRSGRITLTFDNDSEDILLKEARNLKGTEVYFCIKLSNRKSMKALFDRYANEDYEFDRTTYPIILLKQTGAVSRSQAKRLTFGLERFDRVIFDFKDVKELGQGFADEIFRIFQSKQPKLILEVRNANSAVHFMIERSKRF